jgi:hypothetical protein
VRLRRIGRRPWRQRVELRTSRVALRTH